jgi:hypothetical protein
VGPHEPRSALTGQVDLSGLSDVKGQVEVRDLAIADGRAEGSCLWLGAVAIKHPVSLQYDQELAS